MKWLRNHSNEINTDHLVRLEEISGTVWVYTRSNWAPIIFVTSVPSDFIHTLAQAIKTAPDNATIEVTNDNQIRVI